MSLDNALREKYLEYIRPLLTEKRLRHTLGTEKMAVRLAENSGESVEAAQTAALLHDAYKCVDVSEKKRLMAEFGIPSITLDGFDTDLTHGQLSAKAVENDLGITNSDVLNAITYHTTGRPGMSRLEKIIYSADVVEENRVYDVADMLREAVLKDLDSGTYIIMNHVLRFLLEGDMPIYELTVKTYNSLLIELKSKLTEDKSV